MTINLEMPTTSMLTTAAQATFAHMTATSISTKSKIDRLAVRYDAWYLVMVAVVLALGVTILAGLSVWCVVNQHGKFTGNWHWSISDVSINTECAR